MSIPSSGTSSKSADGVSDQFPAGLRVLVVDDDALCLKILEKMLRKCLYEVTKCNRAEIALKFLRDNKNGFDIVLSDVHMPDMDGFKLLEQVGLEMDLPVIMMSADDSKNVVMKGVTHGACDYLIKPVRMEALKNIWQHVIRKKKHELKDKDFEQSGSVEDGEPNQKCQDDIDYSSSPNEGNLKNSRKRNDEEDEVEEDSDTCALKKPRIVWSVELHQQFVAAVNQLGIDKVVPKRILELMNVPGLRRENVASHLQKYRLYLKRLSVDSQHQNQNRVNSPYIGSSNANFGTISSLHGIDFQAQPTNQIPVQSLAALHSHRPCNKYPISVADQRNFFRFESEQVGSNIEMNMLNGIPTTMDPKQLASLNQSNVSRHPLLNGVSDGGLARGVCSNIYNPSVVDLSPLYGNNFPNTRNTGPSSLSLREGLQGDVNLGSKRFVPGYYELQRYASHPSVQSSGGGQDGFGDTFFSPVGGGQNFNPNFGLPPNMVDARFKVESVADTRCPNNIFLQHLGQDDIFYSNSLLEQKDVQTHFGFDAHLSNNLLV